MRRLLTLALSSLLALASWAQQALFSGNEIVSPEVKEEIIGFCRRVLQHKHFDYFVFGHRHLPLDFALSPDSRYINTGDWISHYSFATFDGARLILEKINQ